MSLHVKKAEVLAALRASFEAEASRVAGPDRLISKADEKRIATADLRGAAGAIRDGQPGKRLTVERVVDEALKRAEERLAPINVKGDAFISRAEVDALLQKYPDLGERVRAAYEQLRAGPGAGVSAELTADVTAALTLHLGAAPVGLRILSAAPTSAGRQVDLSLQRNDGLTVQARVRLGPGARSTDLAGVQMLSEAGPLDAARVASLQAALKASLGAAVKVEGFVESTDAHSGRTDYLTAYSRPGPAGGQVTRVARVNLAGTPSVAAQALTAADEPTARSLALALTRQRAWALVQNGGDDAHLEYHLRTGQLAPGDLTRIADPNDSAVGFDPATEALQFQSPSVWGDNAVFVTFARDGSVRLEDFN